MNVVNEKNNEKFYRCMGYPIPFFENEQFSWKEKNPFLEEYLAFINQWEHLYKNLPFVKKIYLCNSLTFNALKEESDIDLFIITEERRIWSTKFFCMILFRRYNIKRHGNKKRKQFCLSFFITEKHQNLEWVSLPYWDPYLLYRDKHLTLLYQEENTKKSQNYFLFWKDNQNISSEKQEIKIGNSAFYGKWKYKTIIEKIGSTFFGSIFEIMVKYLQMIIIQIKYSLNKELNKDVIVSDVMLKFHKDRREEIKKKILSEEN